MTFGIGKRSGILATATTMAVGLLVLLGYFFPLGPLAVVRAIFLQWAIVLAAAALLAGMFHMLLVHWRNLRTQGLAAGESLVLLLALLLSFGLTVVFGLGGAPARWMVDYLILPVAGSLLALLAVTLAYASINLLRRRSGLISLVFFFSLLLALLGVAALPGWGTLPFLGDTLRPWIAQVPAAAGARGILLGVALGVLATGVRILMGTDRPYRDQ